MASDLRLCNMFQIGIESENRKVLTDLSALDGCLWLLSFCTGFLYLTCNVALGFHLPFCSRTPPPGHLVSSLTGEDKDPAESEALHVASGLTSCHQALRVCVYPTVLHTQACVHVSTCVWVCETLQKHRRRRDLFPVKSRSPHNKGPGGGERRNEENIIFLWPLWSAILTFHFQSWARWQKFSAPHLWWKEETLPSASLYLPFILPKKSVRKKMPILLVMVDKRSMVVVILCQPRSEEIPQ